MGDSKAKINFAEGIVELEGSEEFVRSYLEEFKQYLSKTPASAPATHKQSKKQAAKNKPAPKLKAADAETDDTEDKKPKRKRTSTKIKAERFDIHKDNDVPSLEEFIDQKNPGKANGNIIACIGYYITELRGEDSFSEGQIEYAYKMLNLKRPQYLRQIMINEKNKRDLFEPLEDELGRWMLTRAGDIFVSELPAASE